MHRNPGIEGRGGVVTVAQKEERRIMATTAAIEAEAAAIPSSATATATTATQEGEEVEGTTRPWLAYSTEDLKRTVFESTDSAIRSARSLQENSSTHLRTLQDLVPQLKIQYRTYEDAFFKKFKDELMSAREHPAMAAGVAVAAAFLFMRGPRRFLFRHTLGRLQSEEAQYVRAEKNVKELYFSVDLMKLESKKLLERSALAEKEMKHGQIALKNAGSDIQRLVKSVYKIESQAADLMDGLREIPGREALKLRAEVASMASLVRQQRKAVDKRIIKISELGVPV